MVTNIETPKLAIVQRTGDGRTLKPKWNSYTESPSKTKQNKTKKHPCIEEEETDLKSRGRNYICHFQFYS